MTNNKEYEITLQWVRVHYPGLIPYAEYILLAPSAMFPICQHGQCSRDNYITIADRQTTVGDFVDVIVHELTHAKQNRLSPEMSDDKREAQAYACGIQAAKNYMRTEAPWSKR